MFRLSTGTCEHQAERYGKCQRVDQFHFIGPQTGWMGASKSTKVF